MRLITCFFYFIFIFTGNLSEPIDYNIAGSVKPGWEFVQDFFRDNFVHDRDLGASIAAYHHGSLVFKFGGGWFDQSRSKIYDTETLQLVFSTTKGLVAGAIALAVQRGLLDYSAPVIRYWPEYGQKGKENTTVADILSHRAGLPDVSESFDQFTNWTTMISILEQKEPLWPPGSAHGYHALTYGWLAGELIRRVDPKKRSIGQFIQEEISDRIILDLYIGLPEDQERRVSPLEFSTSFRQALDEAAILEMNNFNEPDVHRAEIPAANGIATAWSVARFYSGLIGELDNGKYEPILNKDTLKLATRSNTPNGEIDLTLKIANTFGMGFTLYDDVLPEFGPGSFGHAGFGGSIGFSVPSKNFSFAYVMNRLDNAMPENDQRIRPMLKKIAEYLN